MQKLGNPEPKISAKFVTQAEKVILPGDILLSREDWKLTNPFVPGFWGHAAIVSHDLDVIEAVAEGVRKEEFYRWCYQKDHIAILRVALDNIDKLNAAKVAESLIGTPYDYLFNKDVKAFYCSELVAYAYEELNFYPRYNLGVYTVVPQDFYNAIGSGKFKLIIEEKNGA